MRAFIIMPARYVPEGYHELPAIRLILGKPPPMDMPIVILDIPVNLFLAVIFM